MTGRSILSRSQKIIAGAAIVGFGLLVLGGNLDRAGIQLGCPLGTTANVTVEVLKSAFLVASSQALQDCVFDYRWLAQDLVQKLVSLWLLLFVIGGGLLVRAACRRDLEIRPAASKCV